MVGHLQSSWEWFPCNGGVIQKNIELEVRVIQAGLTRKGQCQKVHYERQSVLAMDPHQGPTAVELVFKDFVTISRLCCTELRN